MEGDEELHPSSSTRLNVVSEEELRSCLLLVPKVGEKVANKIIEERRCKGQVRDLVLSFLHADHDVTTRHVRLLG